MTAKDIIAISISTIALVLSLISLALQYQARVDTKYKISSVSLVSNDNDGDIARPVLIAVNLSFYNMGNRAIAIETIALYVLSGKYDDLILASKSNCEDKSMNKRLLVPVELRTVNQLSIQPFIVPKESIVAQEYIFDLFHFDPPEQPAEREGLVCLQIKGSDASGKTFSASVPLAILKIARNGRDLSISFETKKFGVEDRLSSF